MGLALGVALMVPPHAHSASPDTCIFYAREYVRIELLTTNDPDLRTLSSAGVQLLAFNRYKECLNIEGPLPLPGNVISTSTSAWAAFIVHSLRKIPPPGTVPATEGGWRKLCADEYRTWDAKTETVVRTKSKGKRVPCPYQPGHEDPDM